MQRRKEPSDNVIWLSERRGAHFRGAPANDPTAIGVRASAARASGARRPGLPRLLAALEAVDGAVTELGGAVADLEGRMHRLHDRLDHAAARLDAQKRQNAQVLACLHSGDVAAMEECRARIRQGRPF